MKSGVMYTHDRFMDVAFIPHIRYLGPNVIEFKARWYSKRGLDLKVTTVHRVSREKAREFYPYTPLPPKKETICETS